jgi:hypothetical protein
MTNSPYLDTPLRPLGEVTAKVAALASLQTAIHAIRSGDLVAAKMFLNEAQAQLGHLQAFAEAGR